MPHDRAKREQEVRDRFDFVVFNGEHSLFNAALAVIDVIVTGGTFTIEHIKNQLGEFGVKVAQRMIEAGINPVAEPIYSDVMMFKNWEQPIPGVKVPLPNKFVPYIAARKKKIVTPNMGHFKTPVLQTGTALEESNGYFDFAVSSWSGNKPDLFAIKKRFTGTGKTEVHILSGDSNFSQFVLHTPTALGETDDNWKFLIAPWSGSKPDLIAISKRGTSPPFATEVHIFSGESNFQQPILQTKTALHPTDDTWDFAIAKWSGAKPDLFAIKKQAGSKTEVHILSGESNFSQFELQVPTALHQTNENWDFAVGLWNSPRVDLFAIARQGSFMTDIHILSGESNFGNFILQEGTGLHKSDGSFDFQILNWDGGNPDLMAIKAHATGTRRTEVHIFKG